MPKAPKPATAKPLQQLSRSGNPRARRSPMRRAASKRVEPSYCDVDEDNDDEYNAISVMHLPLTSCAAKTVQEAIASSSCRPRRSSARSTGYRQGEVERDRRIPSHEVRAVEKEIDHVTKKYSTRPSTSSTPACATRSPCTVTASVDDVVNSIEF
ncbi:MAG: hypothetical protein ACLTMP_08255 [Eggerthella lenta]